MDAHCDSRSDKYRTSDGQCNHKKKLGSSNTMQTRFIKNAYDDGKRKHKKKVFILDIVLSKREGWVQQESRSLEVILFSPILLLFWTLGETGDIFHTFGVFAGPKRGRPTPGFSIFICSLGRSLGRSLVRL